jgi:metal-responsive CopG/Arc/MetJ family transcriptional regulator
MKKIHIHILLPEQLLKDIDKIVGPHKRSNFFATAAERRVNYEKQQAQLIKIHQNKARNC